MAEQTNPVFIDVDATSQFVTTDTPEQQKADTEPDNQPQIESILAAQPRRIRCPECDRYTAETEEKMIRHIRKKHRGENPFQCYMCDYSTYNKVLFEEHVRIHQGIKPYKCSHCSYRSVSKKNTKKHELIHRPDNPHKCEQCGFIARHLRALKHHLLTHGDPSPQTSDCSMCLTKFNSLQKYKNHRKSRKRCPECKKMFCSRIYPDHLLSVHGVAKPSKRNGKIQTLFKCSKCTWQGTSKPRILLHLIHHPDQIVDNDVVDTHILRRLGIMNENSSIDNK